MAKNDWSLRDLYRTLDLPGKNPLRDAQDKLATAVRALYGMKAKADPLAFLLALNKDVAAREAAGEGVMARGRRCVWNMADRLLPKIVCGRHEQKTNRVPFLYCGMIRYLLLAHSLWLRTLPYLWFCLAHGRTERRRL